MTTVTTSYWPADVSEPVLQTTVGGILRAAAAAGPRRPAMVAGVSDPAEAVVVGVPDETWGEVVAAFVRPGPGQPASAPDKLRAWCRERLARYKTPVQRVFVGAFPLTPSGKIQKYKLSESFTQHQPETTA
jgi:acyl-CoA synthetase (AMP-forming)/AMP-acid ligase II